MELLYEQAQARPEHTALVYRDERISLRRSDRADRALAGGLAQRGIGPGDAVALVLRDDPWFVVSFHAITALGAVVVPVNPAFKQAELEFNFRSTGRSGGDQRRARRRRLRADRRRARRRVEVISTSAAHGQALHARRAARGGQRRAPRRRARPRRRSSTSSPPARPAGQSACRARTASARPRRGCTRLSG